jgi:hypothetical protein
MTAELLVKLSELLDLRNVFHKQLAFPTARM